MIINYAAIYGTNRTNDSETTTRSYAEQMITYIYSVIFRYMKTITAVWYTLFAWQQCCQKFRKNQIVLNHDSAPAYSANLTTEFFHVVGN